jgi:mannose-6-phosphate isomerase-like protein (cupin superfamily)
MTMESKFSQVLERFIRRISDRRPLGRPHASSTRNPMVDRDEIYHNRNAKLGIDFHVDRLAFADIQSMDPRVVRIAPGCNNELHKHAHESLFVILAGEGEVVIGETRTVVRQGDVAFVPRWIMHQTINASATQWLVVLAVTDFGLTSTVLGDYDRRTRLRHHGRDAAANMREIGERGHGT